LSESVAALRLLISHDSSSSTWRHVGHLSNETVPCLMQDVALAMAYCVMINSIAVLICCARHRH
jgi:hypothetical protein